MVVRAAFAGQQTYSALVPKRRWVRPNTRSPILNAETFRPRDSISPASTMPGMGPARSFPAKEYPQHEAIAELHLQAAHEAVARGHRCRADADPHLSRSRLGRRHLGKLQDFGGAVAGADHGFHDVISNPSSCRGERTHSHVVAVWITE